MDNRTNHDLRAGADLIARSGGAFNTRRETWYEVECYDPDYQLKWSETTHNLVVTAGLNDAISSQFKQLGTAVWYIGLAEGTAPDFAAGDTMASHAGWTEGTIYSQSTRGTLTLGDVASGSASNTLNKGTFSITASGTIGGAFVVENPTKGGSVGTLYGGAAFSTARTVASGDTLTVTIAITTTAS